MNKAIYILFIGILITMSSCRKDFSTDASSGDLEFSKDKVYLDTVFTNIGSSTYTLKVYNRSNKDINIPTIQLAKADSKYRISVDGMMGEDADHNGLGDGKVFNNVELLAKDSLFIFIETTVNIADTEPDFTYNDKIVFDSGTNEQHVDLITLIQDAIFIRPNRPIGSDVKETLLVAGLEGVEGHTLTDAELHWTKDKPYVVYGYAAVPIGKNLIIDPGTRVYFHSESGLVIDNGATLNINGSVNIFDADGAVVVQNEVTFEGDRLEPGFEDVPGQWGTILLFSGTSNTINHLTLKNATVGIFLQRNVDTTVPPNLQIDNSQIYNCSNVGLLARTSNVTGTNLVISTAGQQCLDCSMGGTYDFTHCTFNNNWNNSNQFAVLLDDYSTLDNITFSPNPLQASFKNCIIYGSNNIELFLDRKYPVADFNVTFDHCLVKFREAGTRLEGNPNYAMIRNNINGNVLNTDPKFYKPNQNKLNIKNETSGAYHLASTTWALLVPKDILNNTRNTVTPDIGAYQSAPFPPAD